MKVLLVEDDLSVQQSTARALHHNGIHVVVAATGAEANGHLSLGAFDAVVCDAILPDMDGSTFFESLAERYPELAERTVFVTGWMKDSKVRQLLEYTGQPILSKPVEIEELQDVIAGLGEAANGEPRTEKS